MTMLDKIFIMIIQPNPSYGKGWEISEMLLIGLKCIANNHANFECIKEIL
jgi:hypothetical protein